MAPGTYLMGDADFDKITYTIRPATAASNYWPRKKRSSKGIGHHRHSPYRLHAKRLLERRLGQRLMQQRKAIERRFGNLATRHTGLTHLPAWVRGIRRVGQWCRAKLAA